MNRIKPGISSTVPSDARGRKYERMYRIRVTISAALAVATSNVGVLAATALTASAQHISAGLTNPAFPRNIIVKGNASGNAGNIVIHGTNYDGKVITETIALSAAAAVEGNKAFKTVTLIDLPSETHAGTDTVSIGWGNKLGLAYKLPFNTIEKTYLNNAKEGTAPTVTTSTTDLESNTVKLNTALNGTVVDILLDV